MTNATIYDVSQLANVSIATVSRVLNDPDRVRDKTRQRVIEAIDELGFVPKLEAVTRARKSFGRIGILTPSMTSDSFVDRLRGIIGALSELSYEPIIYDVESDAQRDGYLTSLPTTRQVDGIIAVDLPINTTAARRLHKHKLPTVQIVPSTQPVTSDNLTSIVHDDQEGGRIAAAHLLSKGHQRIGYIGDTELPEFLGTFNDQKLDSFRQTLADNGVALPDNYVRLGAFGMEAARQMATQLLSLPHPPTAIFTGSDSQAIGAMRAIRQANLRVPDDIAVIGFDNIAIAEFIGLTTIDQQLTKSGQLAVEMLIQQIEEENLTAQVVPLSFTLIERETT